MLLSIKRGSEMAECGQNGKNSMFKRGSATKKVLKDSDMDLV